MQEREKGEGQLSTQPSAVRVMVPWSVQLVILHSARV